MQRYPSALEQGISGETLLRAKLNAEGTLSSAIRIMDTLSEKLNAPVVLAGGAVRDALLERPIKDYDFFVSDENFRDPFPPSIPVSPSHWVDIALLVDEWIDEAFPEITSLRTVAHWQVGYSDCETPFGQDVTRILAFECPETGTECQLIFLRSVPVDADPIAFANRVDFGLCKVALAGGQFHISSEFLHDVDNRKMTYIRPDSSQGQIERSTRRATRLHNKYPGYTPVFPSSI